jgi:hypothetical protein
LRASFRTIRKSDVDPLTVKLRDREAPSSRYLRVNQMRLVNAVCHFVEIAQTESARAAS